VRAVDEDHAGARRDGGRDPVDVEIEGGRLEPDAHRLAAGDEDEQLVEEPRRRQEDDLVTGPYERSQRHGYGREAAVRHRHVGGVPVEAGPRPQRLGDRPLRCRLRELVGEPVLVQRGDVLLERLDIARQRHLLRVADGEVRDVGIAVELGEVPAEEGEEGGDALAHALRGGCGGRHRWSIPRILGLDNARMS
jgi:hypothetical protein